eukprot:4401426-Pleurochrysis_carterae.AAC.1
MRATPTIYASPSVKKLLPFVNIWPDLEFCDQETWQEAVELHDAKLANRRAKREALASQAADNDADALFALRRITKACRPFLR